MTVFTKFLKVRNVKSPSRGFPTDAGIDFYVPRFDVKFIIDFKEKNPDLFPQKSIYDGASYVATFTTQDNSAKVEYDLNDKNDGIFKFDQEKGMPYFLLPPHSRVNIPSGICLRMYEPGRALIAFNKSGIATKLGLDVGACVVDYTYQGEIHLNLINTSTKVVRVYEDMKILQFVEMPIVTNPVEVTDGGEWMGDVKLEDLQAHKDFYDGMKKDRGTGGFGSTDKK